MAANKLYVGNINYSATATDLEVIFARYGDVEEVKVIQGKGFGFITMATDEEAREAKMSLDGYSLKGRSIRVNVAHSSGKKGREASGKKWMS